MNAVSSTAIQVAECDVSSDAQRFRWISSSRVISLSFKLCLGAQDIKDWVKVLLLPCKDLSPLQTWECKNETLFGLKSQPLHLNYGNRNEKSMMLYKGTGVWSHWQVYGTKEDLCSRGYKGISKSPLRPYKKRNCVKFTSNISVTLYNKLVNIS